MKCEAMWHQQSTSGVVPVPPAEVPSLMGLDWLFEHTDSEPDDVPCSNPGEFLYTMALLGRKIAVFPARHTHSLCYTLLLPVS